MERHPSLQALFVDYSAAHKVYDAHRRAGLDNPAAYQAITEEQRNHIRRYERVAQTLRQHGVPVLLPAGPDLTGNGELDLNEAELAEAMSPPRKARRWREKHRNAVFAIFGPECVITELPNLDGGLLKIAHLKSVKDCGSDIRGCAANRFNGIPVAGTIHDLYDARYLALSEVGQLLYSSAISDEDLRRAGLDRTRVIFVRPWTAKHAEFAQHHRENWFIP